MCGRPHYQTGKEHVQKRNCWTRHFVAIEVSISTAMVNKLAASQSWSSKSTWDPLNTRGYFAHWSRPLLNNDVEHCFCGQFILYRCAYRWCRNKNSLQKGNFTGEGKTFLTVNGSKWINTFFQVILDHFGWSVHHEILTHNKGPFHVMSKTGKRQKRTYEVLFWQQRYIAALLYTKKDIAE